MTPPVQTKLVTRESCLAFPNTQREKMHMLQGCDNYFSDCEFNLDEKQRPDFEVGFSGKTCHQTLKQHESIFLIME